MGKFWKEGPGEGGKQGRGGEKERKGKREVRKKGKWRGKEEKLGKGRRKPKMIGERYENERRTFPPPFLSVFEITEICLGCNQNGNFYREKNEKWEIF